MSLITNSSNLDYLITPLQFHYGDYDGSLYSEAVYRTALVNAVRYLSKRWNGKYYIDVDNDIQRDTGVIFDEDAPPIILPEDEYALVLAATVILRTVKLTSSADSFTSWQTPDLSVSSGSKERTFVKMYEQALADLEQHFKRGLGKSRKRFMLMEGTNLYPTAPGQRDNSPGSIQS